MRMRRGIASRIAGSLINCVEGVTHLEQPLDLRIISAAGCESFRPFNGRPPAPVVWRLSQDFARSATESLGLEVEERAVHVAHRRAAAGSIKTRLDYRILAGVEIPGASQVHDRATGQLKPRRRVIFAKFAAPFDSPALVKQPAACLYDWLAQDPHSCIDEMDSEIDQTAPAGL